MSIRYVYFYISQIAVVNNMQNKQYSSEKWWENRLTSTKNKHNYANGRQIVEIALYEKESCIIYKIGSEF